MAQKTYVDDLKDRCKAVGYKKVCKEVGWTYDRLTKKLGGFATPLSTEELNFIESALDIIISKSNEAI